MAGERERVLIEIERQRSLRQVQITMGVLSLSSLLAGATIQMLADRLGIDPDTARIVAGAFLVAAAIDAVLLYAWECLFGKSA